jgi:hypothetical protein
MEPREYWAEPGLVAVVTKGDPRERLFLLSYGAGWVDWADRPAKELVRYLRIVKRRISDEFGIPEWRIEAILRRINEYRAFRTRQRLRREARIRRRRRQSVRTR